MIRTALLLCLLVTTVHAESLLLDDFADPRGISAWGSRWLAFTDRVMGGVSDMSAERHDEDGTAHLHISGEVRLENNGGFLQVALPLDGAGAFDASVYRAIRLRVKGNGERYYLHLRTDDTGAPWQYYAADFVASEEWADVEVAFDRFEPASLRAKLDTSSLRRVGVVAAKQRMQADLSIARIELVR